MPLDPVTRAVLDAMEQAFPRVETMTIAESRACVKAMLPMADPPVVSSVEDRVIPGPAGGITVRVYRPSDTTGLPAVVYFHGGGWVICDLDTHDGTCRAIANGVGCVVVSVDYRLAPEHKFPAAAEDAYAATAWVAEHAADLGVDPARIAVAGDSAGGNLAAVVPLMARDRGGPPLAFQLLIYPVADHSFDTVSYSENAEGYFLTRAQMEWFWEQYLRSPSDGAHPYASPLRAGDLRGLPPARVLTAELDPLRDEGEAYVRRLEAAGVAATVARYDGMFHGFFSLGIVLPAAQRATDDAHAALRAAFRT